MPPFRVAPSALLVLAAAAACGSSPETRLNVGGFSVAVPSGWHNASSQAGASGKVAIETDKSPAIVVIFSPAPEPMPFDPTDPVACEENGGRMTGLVGRPVVVDLPAGKACSLETADGTRFTRMIVIRSGDRGVMGNCIAPTAEDVKRCDAIFKTVRTTK